ncbi:AsmA family protein, partial [bacterium]|nr:AsmA family protein [bacterium]
LKITLILIGSFLVILYGAFLFAVPYFVKFDDYTYELNDDNDAEQGLIIKAEKIRISTSWNLSAGAKIGQINGYYKSGKKFAQVDNLDVTVSIPYLFIKQIKIDKISLDKIIARLGVEKDGTFTFEKYLPKNDTEENSQTIAQLPYGFVFSENMPNISAGSYSVTLTDNSTDKKYVIKGSNFKISDFYLNKKIRIKALGEIVLDSRKQFDYNLDLTSHVMPDFTKQQTTDTNDKKINIIYILKNIYNLNLTASIVANVKLKGSLDDLKTYGTASFQNLSVKVQGAQLPASRVDLAIDGNTIKILSDLYTGKNEKANIDGLFQYGKKQYIDLNVKSKHLELKSIFALINASLSSLGLSDINGLQANGVINADFNIKSDFKTINSDGFLKVSDANIYYNIYKVALKNINSDIDFSRNQINIKKADADFNGAPLSLKGAIDTNAYANLSILADKIPLKAAIVSLGQIALLNENDIKSGVVTLNGEIKGKLDKIKPQVNINLDNINIYNKPNKISAILSNAKIEAQTDGIKTNGVGTVNGLKLTLTGLPTFSIPSSKVSFDENNINLDNVNVYLNNSKINVLGKIKNYSNSKMNIDITANGMLGANDIKNSLDKSIRDTVSATGRLPVAVRITGNDKIQNINGQLLANNTNHLSIIDISSLSGKTSLINASMLIENNVLKINDISINALPVNRSLSSDFSANLSGASKILSAKGSISNLTGKVQNINGLNVSIPTQSTISIPGFKNSKVQLKGDLNLSGAITNPAIIGVVNIPNASIPTLQTNAKNIKINATKNLIDLYCGQVDVADSSMNIVATMSSNLSKGINIKSMEFNALNINADTLSAIIANLPQAEIAPGTDAGITITNGKAKIERISSGTIVATNITSDFNLHNNLFKMNNISGIAYGGKIAGNIDYNLLYSSTNINIQGRNLIAQSAMYACTGVKNLIEGTLDFDAINLKTIGLTEEQIMQTLKGNVNFQVLNGQMGTLGKLENLLYAQNILSNNILKASMGAVAGAVKVKKTGDFKYIKGQITLRNGWALLDKVQTSGSAMSMYIVGKYNILTNYANITALGRLSNEVVDVLGPIGKFSVNSIIASIPKIGSITSSMINQITTNPAGENLSLLPALTPAQENTKEYKALIDGAIDSTSSVKYFKWLATPKASTTTSSDNSENQTRQTTSPVQQSTQQAVQKAKTNVQNAINKVINMPTSTQTTTPNVPANNNGVADFINKLPDLNK